MKKGRFSKEEITFIEDNLDFGSNRIATELDRDPESVLGFIKKKVAKMNPKDRKDVERMAAYFN